MWLISVGSSDSGSHPGMHKGHSSHLNNKQKLIKYCEHISLNKFLSFIIIKCADT